VGDAGLAGGVCVRCGLDRRLPFHPLPSTTHAPPTPPSTVVGWLPDPLGLFGRMGRVWPSWLVAGLASGVLIPWVCLVFGCQDRRRGLGLSWLGGCRVVREMSGASGAACGACPDGGDGSVRQVSWGWLGVGWAWVGKKGVTCGAACGMLRKWRFGGVGVQWRIHAVGDIGGVP